MSTSMARRGGGGAGGGRQFPVGRRRHVPVVDSGCGCRPRRPRLLSLASSFIWPSSVSCKQAATAVVTATARGGRGGSSPYYFRSSSSAASFSSSSAATTTYSTAGYSSTSHYSSSKKYDDVKATTTIKSTAAAPSSRKKKTTTRRAAAAEKKVSEEDGVGVAVEKESSDPRADFRESMVQMVVEMGLCHWDDLRCMLRRLLALNAPSHHAAILTAFAEVCAQLAAPSPPPAYGGGHRYRS